MTKSGKAKVSAAMKAYWAERRLREAQPKEKPAKKNGKHVEMLLVDVRAKKVTKISDKLRKLVLSAQRMGL